MPYVVTAIQRTYGRRIDIHTEEESYRERQELYRMASSSTNRAPKQWQLTKTETINSFNNWKENLIYTLSLDKNFSPYVKESVTWGAKSTASPHRGFTDDTADVIPNEADRKTKEDKCTTVDLMLGQIANFATVISRTQITQRSTSLGDIWNKIREHYGFQCTGSRFLDLASIKLDSGERAEDLYQRLLSFFEDNLQVTGSVVTHHGVAPNSNEELSPTVENITVVLWLEKLHVGLPALVKQRYGSELRNKTLASIKSEISLALNSLLEELKSNDESRVLRIQPSRRSNNSTGGRENRRSSSSKNSNFSASRNSGSRYCCLCRTANRPGFDSHYLSQCKYLPEEDRTRLSRVRYIEVFDDEDEDSDVSYSESVYSEDDNISDNEEKALDASIIERSNTRRVTIRKSNVLKCFYQHHPIAVILDTGSESNLVSDRCAKELDLVLSKSSQGAVTADGKTSLTVVGEVKFDIVRGSHVFVCEALVVKEDVGDVVGGEPFLERNDIYVRSSKKQIVIADKEIVSYSNTPSS